MNYIILDLEWNQCPQGKEEELRELPFEVVEIGAMKMTGRKQVIGEYHEIIRPVVYHQFHHKTQEILQMDEKQFADARVFSDVIRDFFLWCGNDYKICTWGSMDLTELQRNIRYHQVENPFPSPLFYYDLQKLFSLLYEDGKSRKSLEYAVEYLQIEKSVPFHRAIDDAYYTVEIMKRMNLELVKEYDSVDYFRPPARKSDEIYMVFRKYAKYVSRTFNTKEEALSDHTVLSTRCYQCGKLLRKRICWFPTSHKIYLCLTWCPVHGYMKGKIRIKKTDEGKIFVVKTLKLADEREAGQIVLKRDEIRRKRRERKKK